MVILNNPIAFFIFPPEQPIPAFPEIHVHYSYLNRIFHKNHFKIKDNDMHKL